MIWVLAGTKEGREIIRLLREAGTEVLATAITAYGGDLLAAEGSAATVVRALSQPEMAELIRERGIRAVVDATHPFARSASENARGACHEANIPYIRYEREPASLPDHPLLIRVPDVDAAAARAARAGGVIFLTTGSNTLEAFLRAARERGRRVVARVLPDPGVLSRCLALGFSPRDIIAMQGPFSRELNRILYLEYGASVVVTKESGDIGGVAAKVEAALDLSLPVVVIDRPAVDYGRVVRSHQDLLRELEEAFHGFPRRSQGY